MLGLPDTIRTAAQPRWSPMQSKERFISGFQLTASTSRSDLLFARLASSQTVDTLCVRVAGRAGHLSVLFQIQTKLPLRKGSEEIRSVHIIVSQLAGHSVRVRPRPCGATVLSAPA